MMEYRTLLLDPPWQESGGGAKYKRGADRHYDLLRTRDMPAVILNSGVWYPAPSAHLYLWVTNNHLPDGLWLTEQLGFRYVTLLTWAKDRFGLGRYYRGQTEHMLFAVRGSYLPPLTRTGSTLITAKRRQHSQKPDEAYRLIERVSPGPRLEMFARSRRLGWDAWGYELDKRPQQWTLFGDEVSA